MEIAPGYKKTDVGIIPEQWATKPLGEVLSKARLGGNYANGDEESPYPLMKMGNLGRGRFDFTKVQFVARGATLAEEHRLSSGDVLLNTRNTLDLVGKVAIWKEELPLAFYNSNLLRLEFDSSFICSNEYACSFLNTEGSLSKLRALATGTTSVAAIYTRDLLGLPIAVPPAAEQRAIATALSEVDALIAELERLIAKKRDIKQAAMQQLLTCQTRLPGFSGEWEVKELGELCSLKSGQTITTESIDDHSPYRCFGGNGLRGYTATFTHDGCHVLIGRQGALCGNVIGVAGKFFASEHALVVSVRNDVATTWLTYVLARMNLNQYSESSAQPGLSAAKLLLLDVLTPPSWKEQTAIAAILSDMDTDLSALEARLSKTRAIKQGMMQELLTGRTRLLDPEATAA